MLRKIIRSKVIVILIIFPVLLLAATPGEVARRLDLGAEAPDFALRDTDGAEVSLTGMRDKIAIVVFWRAKQERSADALAILQSIYEKYKEQGVEILALSNDKSGPETINEMKQSKELTFPMAHDPERKTYGDYKIVVTPSIFVIDRMGKLNYYYPGYRDDFARQITGRVEVLLGKKTLEELEAELQPVERVEVSEGEKKGRRYLKMGDRLMEKGMARSAMLQYQKAIQAEPGLLEARLHLGDIYLDQKKVAEADAEFRQVIELKPRSGVAHAGLGDVLFFQGQLEKSVEMLQIALKLNPKLARAHYRLGRVHEERGQIEDALSEYRTALGILLKTKE